MNARHHRVAVLSCLLVLTIGCNENTRLHPEPTNSDQLKVVAFYSTSDNEQGYSPAKTAEEAAQDVEIVKNISKEYNIILDMKEDVDNMADAAQKALDIQADPTVLAVVGHSRSDITLASLPHYAKAGIPVLIPSATSPYVPYNFNLDSAWPDINNDGRPVGAERFQRVYRLLPRDVPEQVDAIASTTLGLLPQKAENKSKDVMLVCDVTKGSSIYVKPICESLLHHKDLGPHISSYRKFDLDTGDIYGIVTDIHAVKSKHIIVIAYPQIARALIQEIKERAYLVHEKISNYTFIFPDACMTAAQDLADFGARVFITSPLQSIEKSTTTTDVLIQHIKRDKANLTQECYTFDAILMVFEAIKSEACRDRIGRDCIAKALQDRRPTRAGCGIYRFSDGESDVASYHIFAGCKGKLEDIGVAANSTGRAICKAN